jgi:hypothetical protein
MAFAHADTFKFYESHWNSPPRKLTQLCAVGWAKLSDASRVLCIWNYVKVYCDGDC